MAKKIIILSLFIFFAPGYLSAQDIGTDLPAAGTEADLAVNGDIVKPKIAEPVLFYAEVVGVISRSEQTDEGGGRYFAQKLRLIGQDGDWQGKEIIYDGTEPSLISKNIYEPGDRVIMSHELVDGQDRFYITDYVRHRTLYWLAAVFALVIMATGRWKGMRSLVGLFFSFLVILYFIIPRILAGADPIFTVIIGSTFIIFLSTYLVYGLNKKSSIAIAGTVAGFIIVGLISVFFSQLAKLSGLAQEESMFIAGMTGQVNMYGLMLASFIIGALGVLDDITISQVSVVKELSEANPGFRRGELFKRAMSVGTDHIASMVNTLFLAYAGASFPLLLLFVLKQEPFLTANQVINHEVVATEIVRTLTGSIGLALVVPITTLIAAYYYTQRR